MKYKVIKEDKELSEQIRQLNMSEIARHLNVSRQYIYDAVIGKFVVNEEFYNKLKLVVKQILNK